MRVRDVLSGIPSKQTEVEIVTGHGGGDCGYTFHTGSEYVVYAYTDAEGRLATGICSRTRPLDQAMEDVAYFHKMAQEPATGELRVLTGKPGVTILAEGLDGRHLARSDVAGDATFPHLQPGEYSIHQESDGNLPNDPKVKINAKGCVDVTLFRFLELAGRVTTIDGRPAGRTEVELGSARGSEGSTMTDQEGRYALRIARPGTYQLGVNLTHSATRETPYPRWFFPGTDSPSAAAKIDFSGRPESRIYDFILPERLEERVLEGFVAMADGRPAPVVRLFVLDSSQAVVAQETADPNGHFSLRVFAGVPYKLHAVWLGNSAGEATSAVPADIPAGSGSMVVRLTLDQPGNSFAAALQDRSSKRP